MKRGILFAVVFACVLGIAGCGVAGTNAEAGAGADGKPSADLPATGDDAMTAWKAAYPEVFAEYEQENWVTSEDYGHTRNWSHSNTEATEYGGRAYSGLYDYMDWSACIACKSTYFNDLYNEYGDAAFTEMKETDIWKDVPSWWGCDTCHTSVDDLTLRTNMVYYENLVAPQWVGEDINTLVCGQCHNFSGVFYGTEGVDDHMAFDIYRNGTDPDGLYKTLVEYTLETGSESGFPGFIDPVTGAILVGNDQIDLESFMGSNHQKLGMTCVDCHGAHYNGSPLENEETLEYCLTCHESRGIESTAAMRDMVQAGEAELKEALVSARATHTELGELLAVATEAGQEGAAIDEAREKYSKAYFDLMYVEGYNIDFGKKLSHNPAVMRELTAEAQTLSDESVQLMTAAA